jgi:transcriptional regulator with PAS, ATPase and Fis domain
VATTEQKPTTRVLDSARRPRLHLVYSGEHVVMPPRVFGPLRGAVPIGREVASGIVLDGDKRASRHHATLHSSPTGALRLVDEQSRNGTLVNGVRISEQVLADGDVINVGDSYLVVREQSGEVDDAAIPALLGWGPAMRAVRSAIARAAPAAVTVLILGESGCGKELVARALHERSRAGGPFVAVNCAAIPESLAESQLFGQLAGTFTGGAARPGFFRAADGGTLFLDELGEMPAAIQPKLLRALQDRAVVPVGGTAPVPCDVRVVAATNRNLRADVDAGRFRGDLYARIAELVLGIPPLRERREDVLGLLLHALGDPGARIAPSLAEALLAHPFPFNVREVQAIATQLKLRGAASAPYERGLIDELLPAPATAIADAAETAEPDDDRGPPGRDELEALLRRHRGVVADIARAMNRSRKQVYRWLAHHGLDAGNFR